MTNSANSRQTKQNLADAGLRMRYLLDAASEVSIIATDLSGTITVFNSGAEHMLGYRADEVVGKQTPMLIHLESEVLARGRELTEEYGRPIEGFEVFVSRARQGGVERREWTYVRKDGTHLTVSLAVTAVRDEQGDIVGLLGVAVDVTELRHAERELLSHKKQSGDVLDSIVDGVTITDLDGHIVNVNCSALGQYGYTSQEVLGGTIENLFVAESDIPTLKQALSTLVSDGSVSDIEYSATRKDGSVFSASASLSLLKDPQGRPSQIIMIHRDITDRISSESTLRMLYRAVEQSSCIILITDTTGVIEYVNPRFTQTTGYSSEEVIGKTPRLLQSGEQSPEFYKDLWETIKSKQEWHGEFHNRCKDGTLYWANASISPVIDDDGEITHFLAVEDDVTERKETEEALRASEEKFRAISESALDAVIMIDSKGTIVLWNETAEHMFGYRSEEAIGRYVHSVVTPPKYRKPAGEALKHFAVTGEGNAIRTITELEGLRKDGSEMPIEISICPIRMKDMWWAVAFIRDITERKRAEEDARRHADALKTANKELQDAYLAVEAAAKAKSEFLANMSHEIRTPMNGIIGMSGLLSDTPLTKEQREYTETICQSAEALLTIVNDVLDFSKVEAGQLNLELIDFDPRHTLDGMLNVMALKAQQKGLELTCAVDSDVPATIGGDPGRLRQIMLNLVNNAIKFTNEGEVAIHLAFLEEEEDRVVLRFDVVDTGIGIKPEKRDSLFDAFTQADASTSRRYGGTGLGLAICRRLVELMDGQIGVDSELGVGSRFWFTATFEKRSSEKGSAWTAPEDVANQHILVVDDNATNRRLMRQILDSWGCRYDEAPDAHSAMEKMHHAAQTGDPFRVAIIDMSMPDIDGVALGKMIKEEPSLADTILIMMTSLGDKGPQDEQNENFAAYLSKPVKQSVLYDCLVSVLARRQAVALDTKSTTITEESLLRSRAVSPYILLAEDNPVNQKVALGILNKLGCRVDAVNNGQEVLHALETTPYDLVLMDVQMPEMDGLEASRRIRDQESNAMNHDIPIIAMTAHALVGDREKCLEAGMNDYLPKPVRRPELAKTIQKWIALGRHAMTESKTPSVTFEQIPITCDSENQVRKERPSSSGENQVCELDSLLQRYDNSMEFVRELAELFLNTHSADLARIHHAIDQGDCEDLVQAAHRLKGSLAALCAETAADLASRLEQIGREGKMEESADLANALEEEISRFRETLTALTE